MNENNYLPDWKYGINPFLNQEIFLKEKKMIKINLDNVLVTETSKPYVIAEIGHNHMGSIEICKELISQAKICGADAVKLQKRNNKELFTEWLYNMPYQNENSYGKTYGEHREALEFNEKQYIELIEYSKKKNITFFATPFDKSSLDMLDSLNMPFFKIQSGDIPNLYFIKEICKKNRPILLSTGASTKNEIARAVNLIRTNCNELAILHCVSLYPARAKNINLGVLESFRKKFNNIVGFSSHYNGIIASCGAYMMGAQIIEQHFTLDHTQKGTDHALSLEPKGLKELVHYLNELYYMRKDCKDFDQIIEEVKSIEKLAKSMYYKRDMKKGELLIYDDIELKIPRSIKGLPIKTLFDDTGMLFLKNDHKKGDLVSYIDL